MPMLRISNRWVEVRLPGSVRSVLLRKSDYAENFDFRL